MGVMEPAGVKGNCSVPSAALLEDICTRFILTAPEEQLLYFESLMFLVEQAHWYYEDYVRDQDQHLKPYTLKEFAKLIFTTCKPLRDHTGNLEDILNRFKNFKKNVPVMGGILLDPGMKRTLLVKGWGPASHWGFPKGKKNKDETDAQCAVREVMEETGCNIEEKIREEDLIQVTMSDKKYKLYIAPNIDPATETFAPNCKGEISAYAWHHISDLPSRREEANKVYQTEDGTRHKFWMVWPFMKPLKRWIKNRGKQVVSLNYDVPQSAANSSLTSNGEVSIIELTPALSTDVAQHGHVDGASTSTAARTKMSTSSLTRGNDVATSVSTPPNVKERDKEGLKGPLRRGKALTDFYFDKEAVLQSLEIPI